MATFTPKSASQKTPPSKNPQTKQCKACGATMDVVRGVCPKCGNMTPWFQVRLYVGCGMILLSLAGIGFMLYLALIAS